MSKNIFAHFFLDLGLTRVPACLLMETHFCNIPSLKNTSKDLDKHSLCLAVLFQEQNSDFILNPLNVKTRKLYRISSLCKAETS